MLTQSWWAVLDQELDFIFNANMVHIAPWAVSQGLFNGSGKLLKQGGKLCLYGPFIEEGVETAESNLDFDQSLRSRNVDWGIRSKESLVKLAKTVGLLLVSRVEMPSNNLMLWFEKRDD